jgi:hypothetical protein
MHLARLGLTVGFVLVAGAAGAQDPPGDAVDPWVTTTTTQPSKAPAADADAWRGEDPPAVPPKESKVIKKLPGPKPVKKAVVPVRPLKKGQIAPIAEGVPVASFPGFLRLQNGGTRVFLELNKRTDVSETRTDGRVTFRLKGAVAPDKTNRLPLLTGWIPTPVERVQLVEAGPDTDLVIELREKTEFVQRVVETPRGMVLQVDFPPSVRLTKERELGENGMPVAPERARLKTTSTRIDAGNSPF